MDPKHVRVVAIGLLVVLIFSMGYYAYLSTLNPITHLPDRGEAIDFRMQNTHGENFTFSDSEGKVRIITFIYTKCNQGCATITTKMADLRDMLIEDGMYQDVQMITVDFDYRYDTMDDLIEYRSYFADETDTWQFLLGTENQTKRVTKAYNFDFELDMGSMNMTDMNTTTTSEGGFSPLEDDTHAGHNVVYIHPFIVWFIDGNSTHRAVRSGLDWTVGDAYNIVEFLQSEESKDHF